ncbi:MAG TPA: acetyl-CoA hydrolase/transferase C-terminal domain-containing protein [Marmoricola sp.]|nr:acetyl-CoA hydrolase/transferase C-terminal domain-containing protein [Marmoricola sp.]
MSDPGLLPLITPGCTVAMGDGIGAPRSASGRLSELAQGRGVRLLLGWHPTPDPQLDLDAFADVRTLMPGWGLRASIASGQVRSLPIRISSAPALLAGSWRPDVLVATVVPVDGGYAFGSEVSWMRAAVAAGAKVAAIVSRAAPAADAGGPLPAGQVFLIGETEAPPLPLVFTAPTEVHRAIADRVAALVPEGSRLQVGPGALGSAVFDAISVPVGVDSGLLTDGVVDLDERGLLLGEPVGTYLAGSERLLDWADGRRLLHPIEHTHDLTRLATGVPFVAVNTALEIDDQAQVNVEGTPGAGVGGIGGHADYAAAAVRSVGGLSIIALAATHRGSPTLVDRLSAPVTTPGHDVDVVVTEAGTADLRGLDRNERARVIRKLWT